MPRRKDQLTDYRAKRDFGRTPEPSGAPRDSAGDAPRFVIQEHSARSMHWDLRLEKNGVAVSWAVPRGLPMRPKENHLAKQTEDHPLEYLEFEGDIPKGSYGAGTMHIFDSGTYEEEIFDDDKVQVILHGERVQGRYGLVRTRDSDWLIHRMDPAQDPAAEPMPERLEPMLATAATELPREEQAWGFEFKWDGVRALVFCSGGRVNRVLSRNGIDVTDRYPELSLLGRQVGAHEAVLDGEIVAFDEQGRPSFSLLQERMGLTKEAAIRRKAKSVPATLVIFDLLFVDGHMVTQLPYTERRRLLDLLELDGDSWSTPPYAHGSGAGLLAEAQASGFEGVIAKRLDSQYQCGKRSQAWRKIKLQRRQEFVIGGWIEGEGRRGGHIGSLAVGYYPEGADPDTPLVFAGGVGTGFTEATLRSLRERLAPLEIDDSPFDPAGPDVRSAGTRWSRRDFARRVHWVHPELVCEVEYTEITNDGLIRHPSYKGLREDRPPLEVVLEPQADPQRALASAGSQIHEPAGGDCTGSRAGKAEGKPRMLSAAGRRIRLSNPAKVLYPAPGYTKSDVAEYMLAIAPVMLPHLKDRPLTMKRYPDGVDGEFFFEKHRPSHTPDWMRTVRVPRREDRREGEDIEFVLVDDEAGLAWLANLAALELHVPLARAPHVDTPDMVVFDLDPGPPATIVECCDVGLMVRELCEAAGLRTFAKTSGRKGLQMYVPLNDPQVTYEHTRTFSNAVARLLERQHPRLVVSKMTKALRTGKVLVDWSQNHVTKTTICAYSLREFELPTVSTPVAWSEVERCADARDPELLRFTAADVLERVREHGDLFADVLSLRQQLPGL